MTKVSIIIPTHNRKALLCDALDSVFSQTFKDFEIIVIDDGDGGTENFIEIFGNKVNYIRRQCSGLPSIARNEGLLAAKGELIAFLDSDDQWLPLKLERQIRIMDACPDIGITCCNAFIWREIAGTDRQYLLNYQQVMRGNLFAELLNDNFIITSSCIIRKSVLDLIGGFSEDPLLRVGEDYDLWLRAALKTEICYIPDPLVVYRDQGDSIRSQQTRISFWLGMILILDHLKDELRLSSLKDARIEDLIEKREISYRIALCDSYLNSSCYKDAVRCLVQLFWKKPSYLPVTASKIPDFIKRNLRIGIIRRQ